MGFNAFRRQSHLAENRFKLCRICTIWVSRGETHAALRVVTDLVLVFSEFLKVRAQPEQPFSMADLLFERKKFDAEPVSETQNVIPLLPPRFLMRCRSSRELLRSRGRFSV